MSEEASQRRAAVSRGTDVLPNSLSPNSAAACAESLNTNEVVCIRSLISSCGSRHELITSSAAAFLPSSLFTSSSLRKMHSEKRTW